MTPAARTACREENDLACQPVGKEHYHSTQNCIRDAGRQPRVPPDQVDGGQQGGIPNRPVCCGPAIVIHISLSRCQSPTQLIVRGSIGARRSLKGQHPDKAENECGQQEEAQYQLRPICPGLLNVVCRVCTAPDVRYNLTHSPAEAIAPARDVTQ